MTPVRAGGRGPTITDPNAASLFDSWEFRPAGPASTIADRFRLFHEANPWVYRELVKLARGMVERGHSRIGIGMLFEVLRWNWMLRTNDASSEWKLNNSYRSRYSRLIAAQEPDLADIFETRKLRAA